jgi:hypothetical protein
MVRLSFVSALILVMSVHGVAKAAGDGLVLLFPANSEKSNEEIIGKYLEKTEGWKITYQLNSKNHDDVYLKLTFGLGDIPSLSMTVDCIITGRNRATKDVTSNVIKLHAYAKIGVKPSHPHRKKVLELINDTTGSYLWPQRMYLDRDGDLALEALIAISGKDVPAHPGQINYEIRRMIDGWETLHKKLIQAGIKLEKAN